MTTSIGTLASPRTSTTDANLRLEKKARRLWTAGVVALLGLQITIGAVSIYLANSDPTVAIVPDYYQEAVNWDVTRRALQRTDSLGWNVQSNLTAVEGATSAIQVSVLDESGTGIPDLRVTAEVFHHARANNRQTLLLTESHPGLYSAPLPQAQPGMWQVNVDLEGVHGLASVNQSVWAD